MSSPNHPARSVAAISSRMAATVILRSETIRRFDLPPGRLPASTARHPASGKSCRRFRLERTGGALCIGHR